MKRTQTSSSYDVVRQFEDTLADYCGAKYGISVASCTFALFLCCKYLNVKKVYIPKYTYAGVPSSIIHAGGRVKFEDENLWEKVGFYQLKPYPIYDSAIYFKKGMYIKNTYWCLSFQYNKHIPIGRGGMILCNDKKAVEWFKQARFDGRHEVPRHEDWITMLGWNEYMTPEQAARGLILFDRIKNKDLNPCIPEGGYADLSQYDLYERRSKWEG